MRQSQPHHRQQLWQNPARQQRQDNQQKHLDRVLARIAVDIPEQLLDRVDHALDEALARAGAARRGREAREDGWAGGAACRGAAETEDGGRGVSCVVG